jgi:hypothetical protein
MDKKEIIKMWNQFRRWFISKVLKKKITFTSDDWTGTVYVTLVPGGGTKMTYTRGNNALPEGIRNRAFVFCHSETASHIPEGYCKFLYTIEVPEGWTNSGQQYTITKYVKPTDLRRGR